MFGVGVLLGADDFHVPEFWLSLQSSLDALKHRMVPSFAGCPGNLPLSGLWSPSLSPFRYRLG